LKTFALLLVLGLCACKSAPAARPAAATTGAGEAAKFYPLAVGNSWTYAVSGVEKRETIVIVGRDGPWFLDDHRGRLRYESDGLRDADRYLLRTPLAAGAKWSAVENLVVQRFEVVSLDASLVTQAGTFTRCAVVRNEQPLAKGKFVTEWTWAPGVGLAQIVTSTIDAQGKQQEQTKLQLVAYHLQ
jgi:hypothetical protein